MQLEYTLHPPTYDRVVRLFSRLRKILGINVKLHGDASLLTQGEIFLFNHFARTETFLPHYFIHKETGCYCRAIATHKIFQGSEKFSRFLGRVGVLPDDYENLLSILVADIIKGHKVIIFPEGGMIKNRSVVDDDGNYQIYSPKKNEYRKLHTGAAVLALAVAVFKRAVRDAERKGEWSRLEDWVGLLELKSLDQLIFAAHRTTRIVPGNITFSPIHTDTNFIYQAVNKFGADLGDVANEELLIEANILLKNTDMDMRLGESIPVAKFWPWWQRRFYAWLASKTSLIEDFFSLESIQRPIVKKAARFVVKKNSEKLRDEYMRQIYENVTINLYQLTSSILIMLAKKGKAEIPRHYLYLVVYLVIKQMQKINAGQLHRNIRNPEMYENLVHSGCHEVNNLLSLLQDKGLLECRHDDILISEKILHDYDPDNIRLENIAQVYQNEIAPIRATRSIIQDAITRAEHMDAADIARYRHEDELLKYEWCHYYFSKARYDHINATETIVESGRPLLYGNKDVHGKTGVLLVHGFLASPAEVKPFAKSLNEAGYTVYCPRLAGHGTSPADLRGRTWQDWYASVRSGYEILGSLVDEIHVIAFSTGGCLSLIHAATGPDKLISTIVINAPVKFKKKSLMLVPIINGVSRVTRRSQQLDRVIPYRNHKSEHPRINYQKIPLSGLTELSKMNKALLNCLDKIRTPTVLFQSIHDPVINPVSARLLLEKLTNATARIIDVDSHRHGILYENIENIQEQILRIIQGKETDKPLQALMPETAS